MTVAFYGHETRFLTSEASRSAGGVWEKDVHENAYI